MDSQVSSQVHTKVAKNDFKADMFRISLANGMNGQHSTRVDSPVEWPNGGEPLSTCVQI